MNVYLEEYKFVLNGYCYYLRFTENVKSLGDRNLMDGVTTLPAKNHCIENELQKNMGMWENVAP